MMPQPTQTDKGKQRSRGLVRLVVLVLVCALAVFLPKKPSLTHSSERQTGARSVTTETQVASPTRSRIATALEATPIGSLGPNKTNREHYIYYDSLFFLTMQYGRQAKTLLEVGCSSDPFAQHLSWIDQRSCVAPYQANYGAQQLGISRIVDFVEADFMEFPVPKKYDLIVCSQVVEHVPDPAAFMKKLIESATTSIISVPYNWLPCGKRCNHVSNHITLDTILEWSAPHKPRTHMIISEDKSGNDKANRIVVVFSDLDGNLTDE